MYTLETYRTMTSYCLKMGIDEKQYRDAIHLTNFSPVLPDSSHLKNAEGWPSWSSSIVTALAAVGHDTTIPLSTLGEGKLLNQIQGSVKGEAKMIIEGYTSGSKAFLALRARYHNRDSLQEDRIYSQLQSLKCKNVYDGSFHITKFTQLLMQLKTAGGSLDDSQTRRLFYDSLCPTFSNWVNTYREFQRFSGNIPDYFDVKDAFQNHCDDAVSSDRRYNNGRLDPRAASNGNRNAQPPRQLPKPQGNDDTKPDPGRPSSSKDSVNPHGSRLTPDQLAEKLKQNPNFNKKCHGCGKWGHIRPDCYAVYPEKRPSRPQGNGNPRPAANHQITNPAAEAPSGAQGVAPHYTTFLPNQSSMTASGEASYASIWAAEYALGMAGLYKSRKQGESSSTSEAVAAEEEFSAATSSSKAAASGECFAAATDITTSSDTTSLSPAFTPLPSGPSSGPDTSKSLVTQNTYHADHNRSKDCWLWDSGSDCHVANNLKWFKKDEVFPLVQQGTIMTGGGPVKPTHIGTVDLSFELPECETSVVLTEVLFVATFPLNIFSGLKTYLKGGFLFKNRIFNSHGNLMAVISPHSTGFHLPVKGSPTPAATTAIMATKAQISDGELWHRRLAHTNHDNVVRTVRETVGGPENLRPPKEKVCRCCDCANATRWTPKIHHERVSLPFQRVHIDLCFISHTAKSGATCFALVTDDKSRYRWIEILHGKAGADAALCRLFEYLHRTIGTYPAEIRFDNGWEFNGPKLLTLLDTGYVRTSRTPGYHHEQAGFHERSNRVVLDHMRAAFADSVSLPLECWDHIAEAITMITNYITIEFRKDDAPVWKSPHQAFWDRFKPDDDNKPDISHLRVLGSRATVTIEAESTNKNNKKGLKLNPRGWEGILVGFQGRHLYKVWNPVNKRVVTTSHLVIYEERSPYDEIVRTRPQGAFQRDQRVKIIDKFINKIMTTSFRLLFAPPRSANEAMTFSDAKEWREAIYKEISQLIELGTFTFIDPRDAIPGITLLTATWAFKYKRDEHGDVKRHKARICARGFQQVEGVDFFETSASTVISATWRILIALAVQLGYTARQVDIVAAFLHGTLKETLYMKQFPMLCDFMRDPRFQQLAAKLGWTTDKIIQLNQPLYGHKQSANAWESRLTDELTSLGFTKLVSDRSVYFNPSNGVIVAAHIDDLLFFSPPDVDVSGVITDLGRKLPVSDCGFPTHFLNVAITELEDGIGLSQQSFVEDIIRDLNLGSAFGAAMPMVPSHKELAMLPSSALPDASIQTPYRTLVGKLNYLVMQTRPDIAFATGFWARSLSRPTDEQLKAATRVLRYLKDRPDLGIAYRYQTEITHRNPFNLFAYCDADFAGDVTSAKSTGGQVIFMCGNPVSWHSGLHKRVCKSTQEAEYYSISKCVEEVLWIRNLLGELGHVINAPITIYNDNEAAIKLAEDGVFRPRTKYIAVDYHHFRSEVKAGIVEICYVNTKEMAADGLTKPLSKEGHSRFLELLKMERIPLPYTHK